MFTVLFVETTGVSSDGGMVRKQDLYYEIYTLCYTIYLYFWFPVN